VLHPISAQESIDTTKVSYTKFENKVIAAIMFSEEHLRIQSKLDSAVIEHKKKIIFAQESKISNQIEQSEGLEIAHSQEVDKNIKLSDSNEILKKQNKKLKIFGTTVTVSQILLLIIILL
jgi:hypothetical protein